MRIVLLFSCVVLLSQTSFAQTSQIKRRPSLADSSVEQIIRVARGRGVPSDVALDVLRQRDQPYPTAKRRALADSLKALAISNAPANAVFAISGSGMARPGMRGTPDPDALTALIEIHAKAQQPQVRQAALMSLVDQVHPARALSYLREIAVSDKPDDALMAVMQLNRFAFEPTSTGTTAEHEQAASTLRELYDSGSLKTGLAVVEMCDIAFGRRWPTKPMCKGRA